MDGGRRTTKNFRERVVLKVPIVLLAAIFIFYGALIALAATNVSSVPQLLTNPTDISPANGDGFFDSTTVSYSLANQGYSNIRIYNNSSATQPLRSLLSNSLQSTGSQSVVWDGKDDGASFLPDKTDYSIKYDGVSFTGSSIPGTGANLGQIAVDNSSSPPTIYVAREGNNGLWRSTDGGTNWTQITYGGNNNVRGIALLRIGATAPNGYFGAGSLFGAATPQTNTTVLAVADSSTQGNPPRYRLFFSHDAGTTWINRSLQKKNGSQTPPPGQLAIDPLGQIYICSNGAPPNGVYKYNYDPDSAAWGVSGLLQDFTNAQSIAIKDSATIFVADVGANEILKSTDGGNSFEVIAGSGSGDGEVSGPQGISFDNGTDGRGRLWIADTNNNRVQQIYTDGQFIQKIGFAQAGYNLTAPIGVAVDGQDNLYVSDTGGNRMTKYIRDNINGPNIGIDNSPPISASIYSVSSAAGTGIYHKGNIALTADAEDTGVGVGWVEFYNGLDLLGVDANPAGGWTYNWATNTLLDGQHFINVKVYDKAYNVKQSVDRIVVVDNTNPTVSITAPTSAGFVRGSVQVTGTASDNNFDQYILEYGAGAVPGTWNSLGTFVAPVANGNLVVWNTGDLGLTGGIYTLRLTAVDDALNQSTNSVTVTLDNDPPTATTGIANPEIFSPKPDGSRVTTIALSSSDNYGLDATTPWKLEIKNTAGLAVRTYTGTGSPASQAWNGLYDDNVNVVQSGTYTYVYTVTDKAGNTFATAPKTVTVDFTGPNVSVGNANPSTFSPGLTTTQIGPMMASDPNGVASWKVEFMAQGDTTVIRTISGVGDPSGASTVWDGRTDGGALVPDGVYDYVFKAYDDGDNEGVTGTKTVVADSQAPDVLSHNVIPNIYFAPNQAGTKTISILGSMFDISPITWTLRIINPYATPIVLQPGVGSSLLYTWNGKIGPNVAVDGTYTYEIVATDQGGNSNSSNPATGEFHIDTIAPTANVGQASNNPFSPNNDGVKENTTINITGSDVSPITDWNLIIEDRSSSPSTTVKEYSGTNATNSLSTQVVWDGKDSSNNIVADGTYHYVLYVYDAAGNFRVSERSVVVDTETPVMSSVVPSPLYIAPGPTGNGYKTTSFNATIEDNLSNVSWNIKVRNSGNELVREFNGTGTLNTSIAQMWDGKNGSAVIQPDGEYKVQITSVDAAGNAAAMLESAVHLDSVNPLANITNPQDDSKLYGLHQIRGTAKDDNILTFELHRGLGSSPEANAWIEVLAGDYNVEDGDLGDPWDTSEVTEDAYYTLRLRVKDKANNTSVNYVRVSIDNKLLSAAITSPDDDEIINGIESIVGAATNTNLSFFKNFRVEAQLQNVGMLSWLTIGSGTLPLSDSTLAEWDTKKAKDGDYILRVLAFDKAGNAVKVTKNVKVDNTPPTLGIVSPANKTIAFGATSEKILVTDVADNISGLHEETPVEMTINDELVEAEYIPGEGGAPGSIVYEPEGGFEDGFYTVTLNLMDNKENVLLKPVVWSFWVDNTIPEAVISSPNGGQVGNFIPIIGTANDKHLTLWKLEQKLSTAANWSAFTPLPGYLASGKNTISNAIISVWKAPLVTQETPYDLRLTVTDINGNQIQTGTTVTVTPGMQQAYGSVAEITDAYRASAPGQGDFLSKTAVIKGKASLEENFKNYIVYQRKIAPGTPAINGTAIANTPTPVDGTLAMWNTGTLNGTYELQVKAFNTTDTSPELSSPTVAVHVDNVPPPVPTRVTNLPASGGFTNQARPTIRAFGIRDTGYDPDPLEKPWVSGIDESKIEMRVDGKLIPVGPGVGQVSYILNSTEVRYTPAADLKNGLHVVTLRVWDKAGNPMPKLIKWSFGIDRGGIQAEIIRPLPGQIVGGNYVGEVVRGVYPIRGIANSKNIKTYKIEAYMVNDPKSNTTPQWKAIYTSKKGVKKQATLFNWKTSGSALWRIRLVVEDKAGNPVTTAPVMVQVDNSAPTVDIPFPANKAVAKTPDGWAGTGVQVPVNDALDKFFRPGSGIDKFKTILKLNDISVPFDPDKLVNNNTIFYMPQGGETGKLSQLAYLDKPGLVDNVYSASLVVYDKVGNRTIKNWTFTVDNTMPDANIVSPANTTIINQAATQINGMAFDKNISFYMLQSKLSFEDMWKTIYKGKVGIGHPEINANGTLGVMPLPPLQEFYDLRLTVVDKAGNISVFPDPEDPGYVPYQLKAQLPGSYDWGDAATAMTHPVNGMAFNGRATPNLLVTGSAKGPDFVKYEVLINGATVLTSHTQVNNGTLATWGPLTGKNGIYTVQVKVTRTGGTELVPATPATIWVDSDAATVNPLSLRPRNNEFAGDARQIMTVSYIDKGVSSMNTSKFRVYIDGFLEEEIRFAPDPQPNATYDNASKTFTYKPDVPMSNGLRQVAVYGEDMGGFPVWTKNWQFNVDSNPALDEPLISPEASISLPVENGHASGIVPISGTAFDPNIASFKLEYTNDVVSPEPAWTTIGVVLNKSIIDAMLFKWDATKLTDGQYKIRLTLVDKAGNTLPPVIRQFTLDNSPAVAAITSPVAASINKGNVDIVGTANDTNFKNYKLEYLRAGTTIWYQIPVNAPLNATQPKVGELLATWDTTGLNGSYTIRLTSTNMANVSTVVTVAVKVDNTAPIVSIGDPISGAYVKGTASISGQASDDNMLQRRIEIWSVDAFDEPVSQIGIVSPGTTSIASGIIGSWNTLEKLGDGSAKYPDGRYLIKAYAEDKAGTSSSATRLVNVDNTKPVVSVNTPVANDFISGVKDIFGTASDANIANYKVEYKLGTASPVVISTSTSSVNNGLLAGWDTVPRVDGNYTIIITATDKANNITLLQIQVKVDNTAPAAEITVPDNGAILSGTIDVKGIANDLNISDWKVEYELAADPGNWVQVGTTGTVNKTGTPAPTLVSWNTDELIDGTYKLRLVVNDKAGNQTIAQAINLTK